MQIKCGGLVVHITMFKLHIRYIQQCISWIIHDWNQDKLCLSLMMRIKIIFTIYTPSIRLSNIDCRSRKAGWAETNTVYPKKYAHGVCFAVLCCGYILTDFPISIRLTSLALWQSNDCPSASKATLMNMDKYFMWIHYERLHNHNKTKHNKTVCIFLGIYK